MSTTSKRTPARKTCRTEWVDRWTPPKPLASQRVLERSSTATPLCAAPSRVCWWR